MLQCNYTIINEYEKQKNVKWEFKILSEEVFEEVNPDQLSFAQGCRKAG